MKTAIKETLIPEGALYIRLTRSMRKDHGTHCGYVLRATSDGTGRPACECIDGLAQWAKYDLHDGPDENRLAWEELKAWAKERSGPDWYYTYWVDGVNCD